MLGLIEMHGATTAGGSDFGPGFDVGEATLGENVGDLADDDFFDFIDAGGKTEKGIDKGGGVDLEVVLSVGMEDGLHFEMGVGEGVDGDLESGFEGRAVGTDVEIDILDS